eukprot:scaffold2746_cov24-Cyclotella_meneghiniana.AAC.1
MAFFIFFVSPSARPISVPQRSVLQNRKYPTMLCSAHPSVLFNSLFISPFVNQRSESIELHLLTVPCCSDLPPLGRPITPGMKICPISPTARRTLPPGPSRSHRRATSADYPPLRPESGAAVLPSTLEGEVSFFLGVSVETVLPLLLLPPDELDESLDPISSTPVLPSDRSELGGEPTVPLGVILCFFSIAINSAGDRFPNSSSPTSSSSTSIGLSLLPS